MKYSFTILLLVVALYSCKENETPVDLSQSGELSGKITLFDENGVALQDNSGVKVSLDSSASTTVTQNDGSWKLSGITSGNIFERVVFSKEGYLSVKCHIYQTKTERFYLNNVRMTKIPRVSVAKLNVTRLDAGGTILIQGKLSSVDARTRVIDIIYACNRFNITSTVGYKYSCTIFTEAHSDTFSFQMRYFDHDVATLGWHKGSTVYFLAFAEPRKEFYPNYNRLTTFYELYSPGISYSNIDSIIVY